MCWGKYFLTGGQEGRTWGKIQSTSIYYEARFVIITVLLLKIWVFWFFGLLDPEYEGTMMLGSLILVTPRLNLYIIGDLNF
jgi:hypothetical protein